MAKRRLLLALLLLFAGPARAGEEIVLASPAYWCPFSCEAGARREGFTVEIIRWIFARHGIAVRLVNENYSRALSDLRKGRYTASPSTLPEEAPDFVFPREAISSNRFCFYTHGDDHWHYDGLAGLGQRQIGIIQGYSYGTALDAFIAEHPQQFRSQAGNDLTERLIRQVQLGRLDAFIEEENLVGYTLLDRPAADIRHAGCLEGKLAYMAIAPEHPQAREYARLFDEGMREMRRSGELARLLATYGLRDWQAAPTAPAGN